VDAGEIERQAARQRGQEPATEGIPDSRRPALENLSRPFRDGRMADRDVGLTHFLEPNVSVRPSGPSLPTLS